MKTAVAPFDGGLINQPLDLANQVAYGVGSTGRARLRYNNSTTTLQVSLNGGAYVDIATGGAVTLQSAYNGGNTIATSGGTAIAFSDTNNDAGNVLTINKAPSGFNDGYGIGITMGANTSGTATGLNIDLAASSQATGIQVNAASVGHAALFITTSASSTTNSTLDVRSDALSNNNVIEVSKRPSSGTRSGAGILVTMGDAAGTVSGAGLSVVMTSGTATGSAIAVTGGTVVASAPILTATQTWNSGGATFKGISLDVTNTASAAASRLIDLQVASSSVFSVAPSGNTSLASAAGLLWSTDAALYRLGAGVVSPSTGSAPGTVSGGFAAKTIALGSGITSSNVSTDATIYLFRANDSGNNVRFQINTLTNTDPSYLRASSTSAVVWHSGTVDGSSADAGISRVAATALGVGNGTLGDVSGTISAAKGMFTTNGITSSNAILNANDGNFAGESAILFTGTDNATPSRFASCSSAGADFDTRLIMFRSRGTMASQSTAVDGDWAGTIQGQIRTAGGLTTIVADMSFRSQGTVGTGTGGGKIVFRTNPAGSGTLADRVVIDNAGSLICNASGSNLAQNATGGFLYVPVCATGAPSGTPTSVTGATALVVQGDTLYFRGTSAWQALTAGGGGGVTVLNRDVVGTTVADTTTETSIYSYSVPGNTLSTNKRLRLTILGSYQAANDPALRIRLNFGGDTCVIRGLLAMGTGTAGALKIEAWVTALNATNSQQLAGQVWSAGSSNSDPGPFESTASEDTTASKTLEVTVEWDDANPGNTLTIRSAILELL